MDIKRLLFIVLLALIVIAVGFSLMGFDHNNPLAESLKAEKSMEHVSMAVTGDVMLGRNVASLIGPDSLPLAGISNVTSNVDLLLINLENAATNSENATKGDIPLKCNPSDVILAKGNNNTIAALANNHVCDYGISGMQDTINTVKQAGMTPIGAGSDENQAHAPAVKEIGGRNITVFNYMDSNNFAEYDYSVMPYANGSAPGYSAYNSQVAQKQIADARGNGSDFIVAYLHFGNEYSTSPNEDQTKIAHELIDYGADIVIGSHPHVTQGVEMYNGKPIFYSLGNCVFDMSGNGVENAYILKIDLINRTGKCTVYPVYISNSLPQLMGQDEGTSLLNGLTPKCNEFKVENGVGTLEFNLTE
ncbi:CapA family protein [uncultured Methanobrevibacter sp.]|uniref:CapA family protein n=1 Tax=uncultured Methanobrevibacter sp. TaxID=253161 RepID=UPI0025D0F4B7|nr:CapA family protein [uncultured Methanobrevibacter sp.]